MKPKTLVQTIPTGGTAFNLLHELSGVRPPWDELSTAALKTQSLLQQLH